MLNLKIHPLKITIIYLCEVEAPDGEGGELLDVCGGDGDGAVRLGAARRPVLVALETRALLEPRHHHDGAALGLPHHLPEGGERVDERTLRRHVRVRLAVAVTEVGVDVVRAGHPRLRLQHHPAVVVRDHVRVPVLRLVHLQTRVVPRELLSGFNRLKYY